MKSVPPQKKIFVSYRVQDTAGETGRLVDALRSRFGNEQLFLDIDTLEPGTDFVETIEKHLDSCDVFLAVIGPRWTGEREGQTSRIQETNDWVRIEVATALRRNVRVVPVLVEGSVLPRPEQLPDDLQPLLRRQSIEITNKRWKYDTDQLIDFLIAKVGIQPAWPFGPAPARRPVWPYVAGGVVLCILAFAFIRWGLSNDEKQKSAATPETSFTDTSKPLQPISPITDADVKKGQDNGGLPGKYPEGSLRYLTPEDVANKSVWELRVMRNEIYARKGFGFETAQMRSYFQSQSWYVPGNDNEAVKKGLTPLEKANINLIQAQENEAKK